MKRLLLCLLLLAVTMTGCARNYYNVPVENFASKVRVLGVAPIFIDAESDIKHPQKAQLIQLVADLNRKYEPQLVRKFKITGNFYTVALLDAEPVRLFESLLFRRELRDDATVKYNKYFWRSDELKSFIQKNNLDAVMLITVSGLTRPDKIYSSNLLTSLEADYNYLTLTAQVLDAEGTVLWEYPNFRKRMLGYSPLINLQYPDFSESDANLARKTEIKFKTIDGIRRALEQKRKDWLLRETQEPEVYSDQFDEIVSLIKYDLGKDAKDAPAAAEAPRQAPPKASKPAELRPEPVPAALPAPNQPTAAPKVVEPVKSTAAPVEVPSANSDEIVPATGSTR